MTELRLSSEPRGDSMVVAVAGELDIVTSRQLDEQLTRTRRQHRRIVLDLAEVEFMDTSSLAVIVGHWKWLQAAGGLLVLAGARYRYTKTLWITGLADRLPLYDSVDEAVAAAARAGAGEAPATRQGDGPPGDRQDPPQDQVPPPGRDAPGAATAGKGRAARA